MVKVYMEVRRGASKHQLYIYFYRKAHGKAKIRTDIRVEKHFYDSKNKRIKDTHPFAANMNRVLIDMIRVSEDTYWELRAKYKKEPTNKELIDTIKTKLGRKVDELPQNKKMDLFTYVKDYLIPRKENENVVSKRIEFYHIVLGHLRNFENETGYKVDFETIDLIFHKKFVDYLNKKNLSKGYIYDSIIKTLVFFLNQATEDEKNTNLAYKNKRFKKSHKSDGTGIYLNEIELEKLYKLNLSDKPSIERVRDIFLVGCYTGLRYSDYKNISLASLISVKGQKLIKVLTQKTGAEVIIPLHPYTQEILEKYKYRLPVISNQKMNQYLKELGKYALIDTLEMKRISRGKKTETIVKPKYEFMTTHTARRSFATNAYMSGEMSAPEIMAITGHKSETIFLRYVRPKAIETASKSAQNSFFNPDNN